MSACRFGSSMVAAVLLSAPLAARAEEGGPVLQVGLRSGYALPFGKMDADASKDISDAVGGVIPVWAEAGVHYRSVFAGAFIQWGYGLTKNCPATISCSASHVRAGLEALFHIDPDAGASPWLGAGFGYEWINLNASQGGSSASAQGRGFEFLSLHAGLDFKLTDRARVGPFVTLTLSQVGTESVSSGSQSSSADVKNTSIHEFLLFGMRLSFDAS